MLTCRLPLCAAFSGSTICLADLELRGPEAVSGLSTPHSGSLRAAFSRAPQPRAVVVVFQCLPKIDV